MKTRDNAKIAEEKNAGRASSGNARVTASAMNSLKSSISSRFNLNGFRDEFAATFLHCGTLTLQRIFNGIFFWAFAKAA